MLTYSFTNAGKDSLYQYLYKCIKQDILNNTLPPGEKLPSKRAFAKNLGVSVITVENAYAQLVAEGYLYSIAKKGFFVADIHPAAGGPPSRYDIREKHGHLPDFSESFSDRNTHDRNTQIDTVSFSSGNTDKSSAGNDEGRSFLPINIDLASNQTNTNSFPFSIWAKLVREVLNDNQQELMTNPPCGGIPRLRSAIAAHLKAFRDISVSPQQIFVGAGTEYLYGLLIQLLGFEKRYGVEDPGYQKIARIYEKHGVACCHIPMDTSGISIADLEASGADIIHLSPSHHFPTGLVTPISRRYELLGWAARSDSRYIIEDDYDSEFRMTGKPVPSMLDIDMSEKVIYMNTFSKTLASTVRISYMVLPMHLVERYHRELEFYSCTVSNFEQYTLARFIEEGYFEKHLNRMRNYYHKKRDYLIDRIHQSPLASYVTIMEEDAGLHFILEIKTALSDQDFCRLALQHGIRIAALSSFYVHADPAVNHRFIINYSSITEENIDEAIALFCKFI